MFIDSHTHLFTPEFDADRAEVLARAAEAGVDMMLLPNIDAASVEPLLRLHRAFPASTAVALGLHPTEVGADYVAQLGKIQSAAREVRARVKAIGEVGMDLYWSTEFKREQAQALRAQTEWALEWNLPLILHVREAFPEVFAVLAPYRSESALRGVFHSFTGSRAELETILQDFPSFCVGINGIVTFKKSHLPELLPLIPVDKLLLETDSPYLAPVPHRGKRNESAFLPHTAQRIAQELGVSTPDLARQTSLNARRLFNL